MLSLYQHLPEKIDPIVFSIGIFDIRWYSISYLVGFTVVYGLLRYRAVRGEEKDLILNFKFQILNQIPNFKSQIFNLILDWMIYAMAGLLVGGRLGYVLFYKFSYYLHHPLSVISPYDFSGGVWMGISGMSYFGGALGAVLASWIWVRKNKINFWSWADFVIPAIPAGYFFGRIGNFWNDELFGRVMEKPWGMYFPADFGLLLRHPSQLYEAFFEGLMLFVILWFWRNKVKFSGQMPVIYLSGYGLFRFGIEFFREPDSGAGLFLNFMTLGQIFSLSFMLLALVLWGALSKSKKAL